MQFVLPQAVKMWINSGNASHKMLSVGRCVKLILHC